MRFINKSHAPKIERRWSGGRPPAVCTRRCWTRRRLPASRKTGLWCGRVQCWSLLRIGRALDTYLVAQGLHLTLCQLLAVVKLFYPLVQLFQGRLFFHSAGGQELEDKRKLSQRIVLLDYLLDDRMRGKYPLFLTQMKFVFRTKWR